MDCLIKTRYFHEINYNKIYASIVIFKISIRKLGELHKNPKDIGKFATKFISIQLN